MTIQVASYYYIALVSTRLEQHENNTVFLVHSSVQFCRTDKCSRTCLSSLVRHWQQIEYWMLLPRRYLQHRTQVWFRLPILALRLLYDLQQCNWATEYGPCPYIARYNTNSVDHAFYIHLPSNVSLPNEFMCGPLNRKGRLCGKCKDGYGTALYSYTLECSKCGRHGYGMVLYYRIAGNFREVQIFAIFATHDQNAKIRTSKYETAKIWTRELLEIFTPCVLCASLARSDVWLWHYSAISNRQTTSYPFPWDIFRPLLARRR